MRLDEINSHGDEGFYQAVGAELAQQLACEIQLAGIDSREGKSSSRIKEITYQGRCEEGSFLIKVYQRSEMGQSPSKPYVSVDVTDGEGFGNGSISLGRIGIFSDDPAEYGRILNHQNQISDKIDDLLT